MSDAGGVGAVVDSSSQPLEHCGLQAGLITARGRYRVLHVGGLELLDAGLMPDAGTAGVVASLLCEHFSVAHQRS